jgi:hypothetical protein
MSDIEKDENNTPLTKQLKSKSKKANEIKEEVVVNESVIEQINEKKARKPKTEKQLEQFKKMTEARKLKVEENKLKKKLEASKFLLEHGVDIKKNKKIVKEAKIEVVDDSSSSGSSSSSSDEEQIIVVKKKKNKSKSKHKKDIIEEKSSDSEPEIIERNFKHQRNKKSIIKVHNEPNKPTKTNRLNITKNYFVD